MEKKEKALYRLANNQTWERALPESDGRTDGWTECGLLLNSTASTRSIERRLVLTRLLYCCERLREKESAGLSRHLACLFIPVVLLFRFETVPRCFCFFLIFFCICSVFFFLFIVFFFLFLRKVKEKKRKKTLGLVRLYYSPCKRRLSGSFPARLFWKRVLQAFSPRANI